MRKQVLIVLALVGVSALSALVFFIASADLDGTLRYGYGYIDTRAAESMEEVVPPTTMALVGDVLFARDVEKSAERYGSDYPFAVFAELPEYAGVVANFESTIPETHYQTPAQSLRFSSPALVAPVLREHGITHVSLANNHAFDFGAPAYANTARTLREAGVTPFGHPNTLSTSSVAFVSVGTTTVGVIGIHPLANAPDAAALQSAVAYAQQRATYTVAYVHWGTEYELTHNRTQQELAHQLVARGVDAVVGHHPHVVQDIEWYQGVPIFYSVGNFIFDQYFSVEVQQGLLLELAVEDGLTFTLRPVSSIGSRTRPQRMTGFERERFLEALAQRSSPTLREAIESGVISLPR